MSDIYKYFTRNFTFTGSLCFSIFMNTDNMFTLYLILRMQLTPCLCVCLLLCSYLFYEIGDLKDTNI